MFVGSKCQKKRYNLQKTSLLMSGSAGRSCGADVLLLLRNSRHNNNTWGLPGGNVEAGDADILSTAQREASEELTTLPDCEVVSPVRGVS